MEIVLKYLNLLVLDIISSSYVEYSLFRHFRANQVNGIFSDGGFVLNSKPELDLFSNRFAWKADILALDPTELNSTSPNLFSISFNERLFLMTRFLFPMVLMSQR